jgi:peptidoglycan hydrolase-like protein with peptidoglycan-binding domain
MNTKRILRTIPATLAATVLAGMVLAGPAHASTTAPSIQYGSTGRGVECVQITLNLALSANLTVDGQDGPLTTAKVKVFQSDFKLKPDGIVGPLTGTAMINYLWSIGYGFDATPCYPYIPTTS